jgi:hypothetical protein
MEFGFTPEQEEFRREVRDFIEEHPPDSFPTQSEDAGYGAGKWSWEYTRKLGERGLLSLIWPPEYGGMGRPMMYLLIMLEELAYHRAPMEAILMNISIAPTLIALGNERLKEEFLPRMARGEVAFWQGYSEPNAGSDLLNLKTTAVADGDFYVINGQKTWSSNAHLAQYGFVLARTDPHAPRHKGLTMFIVDNDAPGVTIRPVLNLAGDHYHNEAFYEEVRVSKDRILGQENQGFYQLLKGLEADRFWGRFVKAPYCKRTLEDLVEYARVTVRNGKPLSEDPTLRQKLAQMAVDIEVCRMLFYRTGWMMDKGLNPTYEASLGKVFADEMGQKLYQLGMEILGPYGPLQEDSKWVELRGTVQHLYQVSLGQTIAGGTSEIIRNTIARIGLGLPKA